MNKSRRFSTANCRAPETELLLKRLMRDAEFRGCFGRYALIGEASRGSASARLTRGFAERVNRAIDVEAPAAVASEARYAAGTLVASCRERRGRRRRRGRRGFCAATPRERAGDRGRRGVTSGRRSRITSRRPARQSAIPVSATSGAVNGSHEALSYTVPSTLGEAPAALPPARLTDYVFAHSEYTSFLGQRNLLSGLIAEPDDQFSSAGSRRSRRLPRPAPPAAAAQVPSDSRSGP